MKQILVITLSNVGDVIMTTPVISALHSNFPDAKLTVVVGPKAAGILRGSQAIDHLVVYNKRVGWSHKWELIEVLREERYDYVVDLRNTLLPFLVRAKKRSPLLRFFKSRHYRDRHLELLGMMKLPMDSRERFDFFHDIDQLTVLSKLRRKQADPSHPYAIVAAGAGSEVKRWPVEGFQEVLTRLVQISSLNFIAVGDEREGAIARVLCKVDPARVFNLAGETTLRELAALVAQAKLVLTNDSAVMHLGYELARPIVAIFGPTHHEKYGQQNEIWRVVRDYPPCAPCERAQCRFKREYCLADLSPDKVFRECENLLKKNQER